MLPYEGGNSDFRNYQLRGATMSTTLVKVQHKGQVTIPSRLRRQAGIAEGDIVEASFQRGQIVLTPKAVIDRAAFPNADGEYTPAQRREINARLAKADREIKSGRTFGPFDHADDMIASIERELKKRAAARKKAK
jgi:AbrB family looped-hinge helix DNA binding protein